MVILKFVSREEVFLCVKWKTKVDVTTIIGSGPYGKKCHIIISDSTLLKKKKRFKGSCLTTGNFTCGSVPIIKFFYSSNNESG